MVAEPEEPGLSPRTPLVEVTWEPSLMVRVPEVRLPAPRSLEGLWLRLTVTLPQERVSDRPWVESKTRSMSQRMPVVLMVPVPESWEGEAMRPAVVREPPWRPKLMELVGETVV